MLLPAPLGPVRKTNSPLAMREADVVQRGGAGGRAGVDLRDVVEANHG